MAIETFRTGIAATGPLPALEQYRLFRSRLEHEDNLISQRLSWLVASQSFLFTAYAIVLNELGTPDTPTAAEVMEQRQLLFRLIPIVAVLTCGFISMSILAAVRAIVMLRDLYRARVAETNPVLPPIQTSVVTRRMGLLAPLLLPVVFICVWLFLLMHGLR